MPERKLINLQWQFIRQYSQASVAAIFFSSIIFFILWDFVYSLDGLQSWSKHYLNFTIPAYPGVLFAVFMVTVMGLVAVLVGMIWGYIQGNSLKKRV